MEVTGTNNFAGKLRRGGIAVAAATAMAASTLFGVNAAQASEASKFTDHECKVIYLTTKEVVKVLGVETLSKDFRQSIANFMVPDGKTLTCTGPTDIATPRGDDVDAFNTIQDILAASKDNPILLQDRGIRSVASLALTLN